MQIIRCIARKLKYNTCDSFVIPTVIVPTPAHSLLHFEPSSHHPSAMIRSLFLSLLAVSAFAASAAKVQAVGIATDGTWLVAEEVSDGNGGFRFADTWTFSSLHPIELNVADIYVSGDTFDVYLGQNLLGHVLGYKPEHDGNAWADDAEAAIASGSFSHASWLLDPGEHEITIRVLKRARGYHHEAGGVSLSATERPRTVNVPESGAGFAALASTLAGMAGVRRWRSRRPVA